MNTLEDLHTLVRLLHEFKFPVSPILEYEIQEKIENFKENESTCESCLNIQCENPKKEAFKNNTKKPDNIASSLNLIYSSISNKNVKAGTIVEYAKKCEEYEANFGRNFVIDSIAIMEIPNIHRLIQEKPNVIDLYKDLFRFFPLIKNIMDNTMDDDK